MTQKKGDGIYFQMKTILTLLMSLLLTTPLFAKERYVYKASVLMALKAKLVIDVEQAVFKNENVIFVKSNSNVEAFGKEVANLDYKSYNDTNTFEPKINIECEHSNKQTSKNCRAVKFLPQGQFLYKEFHNSKTVLEDFEYGNENVVLKDIADQQPTYNPNEHKIYDIASIALLVRYLNINRDNKNLELFVAVNESMAKVRVSYVQDIDASKMWIKLTPINPTPEEFKLPFPHKIIYDKKLKAVTEIHQLLPYVGNTVIKLDLKESSF